MAVKRKKRGRPAKKKSSDLNKNIIIPLAVIAGILLVIFGYYLAKMSIDEPTLKSKKYILYEQNKTTIHSYDKSNVINDSHRINTIKKEPIVQIHVEQKEEKKNEEPIRNIITYKNAPIVVVKKKPIDTGKRAKLVIIIDDVHLQSQIDSIKKTNLKITPSIFPPSEISMHTDALAAKLKHYMVHLPLESQSKQMNKMQGTLMITDAPEKVFARIEEIKRLFPNVKYINNHTGSVYTSNYQSMKVLYAILKQEGITFVDSRTDPHTQVPRVAEDLHEQYISRDVFLDNIRNVNSVRAQLKKVVKVAKKQGYAIAIGHPYDVTMQVLQDSKDILIDVDVVYLDELFGG
jgi:polysaccharide deacetylase 2 family uncharacterized protein YibQ